MTPNPSGWGTVFLLFGLLTAASASAQEHDPSTVSAPLTPEDAVAAALSNHVAVRRADAAVLSADGKRRQSSLLLANPEFSADLGVNGQHVEFNVLQPVSLSGEGLAARRSATAGLASAESFRDRTHFEVAAQARLAYADAAATHAHVELARRSVDLTRRIREGVALKLDVGEGSELDVRLARMAEATAAGMLLDDLESEAEALRHLAAVTGSTVTAEQIGSDPLAAAPIPPPANSDRDRSDVRGAEQALAAAEANLARERAAALPAISLGVNLESDGAPVIGPAVGIELPLFNRNQSGRSDASGELAVSEAALNVTRAVARTEQATATTRHAEASRVVQALGEDLQSDALSTLVGIEAGYRAGEFDLPTAVVLQSKVIEGQAAAIDLQRRLAAARIDLLLATEHPSLLPGGTP